MHVIVCPSKISGVTSVESRGYLSAHRIKNFSKYNAQKKGNLGVCGAVHYQIEQSNQAEGCNAREDTQARQPDWVFLNFILFEDEIGTNTNAHAAHFFCLFIIIFSHKQEGPQEVIIQECLLLKWFDPTARATSPPRKSVHRQKRITLQ